MQTMDENVLLFAAPLQRSKDCRQGTVSVVYLQYLWLNVSGSNASAPSFTVIDIHSTEAHLCTAFILVGSLHRVLSFWPLQRRVKLNIFPHGQSGNVCTLDWNKLLKRPNR